MKRYFTGVLLAVFFLVPALTLPARANTYVGVKNDTVNGAWITVYRYQLKDIIVAAYCVPPHQHKSRTFDQKRVYKVIAEMKNDNKACGGGNVGRLAQDIHGNDFDKTIEGGNGQFSW